MEFGYIGEVEEWINGRMDEADKISDWKFRLLCYYSILDSIVQEYYGYKVNNNKMNFIEFISKYQNKYDFMSKIDPVTLYYDCEKEIANPKMLDFMKANREYSVSEIQNVSSWTNITRGLEEKKKEKHTYIALLYQLRNKLVHEFSAPYGVMWSNLYCEGKSEPFYTSCEVQEKDEVFVNYWNLTFPPQFICDLTHNVIANYFSECKELDCYPYKNNIGRRMKLAWYD